MIIEIDNVELYFKSKKILNGIYLKSETGKITSILGSNGCGKSCLLDIIFGNLNPKYKLIRIDNTPVLKPLYNTGKVSYLPQYNFLPNSLKVSKAFQLFNVNFNAFIQLFPSFDIYYKKPVNHLSTGERRALETYLILKKSSDFVLLDEPFSYLSPVFIEAFKKIISEEKTTKGIIITDHMYRHIVAISDTIYLLKNGSTKLISDLKDLENYHYLNTGDINN